MYDDVTSVGGGGGSTVLIVFITLNQYALPSEELRLINTQPLCILFVPSGALVVVTLAGCLIAKASPSQAEMT